MDAKEIPLLIERCLCHRVQIYPYKLKYILEYAEKYKVPDADIAKFDSQTLKAYIDGLFYSAQEDAEYWNMGHYILESIGFEKVETIEGHRKFVSLKWS
jgi:hypothetical protein